MEKAHVLYVSNMDETRALLILKPDTEDEKAIAAIEGVMREVELSEIDEEEYYTETETAPGFFRECAESIWCNNCGVYIENRWEANYSLALNVPIL